VHGRRADKTDKSDSEQALKLLDGEPEVSCGCFHVISDSKEGTEQIDEI